MGGVAAKAKEPDTVVTKEKAATKVKAETKTNANTEIENFTGASGKSGDLYWKITSEGKLTITGNGNYKNNYEYHYKYDNEMNNYITVPEWSEYNEYIYEAEINVRNITSTEYMLAGCSNLKSLDISRLDTSNVTDMYRMFYECSSLTSLDLSDFNTSNVKNMGGMFEYCSSLSNLDVSGFVTSNVTFTGSMFNGCSNLSSLDVSGFDTSNVRSMNRMFRKCSNLSSLDVSGFDTSNVIDMGLMFSGCSSLTSLDVSGFDTSNVTHMGYMFSLCSSLESLDVSGLDTSNVTSISRMFAGCSSLISLDVSRFNTSNVTDMASMFFGCSSLRSLDVSGFNTSNVTAMYDMFNECSSLKSLDISNFDTSKAECLAWSFTGLDGLDALEKLYFFANSTLEYDLPSSTGFHWINEDNETCIKTAKELDRKMLYTRVEDYTPTPAPVVTPTPVPTASPVVDDVNTGIYLDSACTTLAPLSVRTHYVNGGNVKQTDNTKTNYKTKTYYTQLKASNIVTVNKKGKIKTKKGKLVAGITASKEMPVLVKGRIRDASVSKVASASISKGRVKVTAKSQPGVCYLWVMDTGDDKACACAKLDIKAAPSSVQIFAVSSGSVGFSYDRKNFYKKDSIELGSTVKLYIYPSYKLNKVLKKTEDASYSVSVDAKSDSYFTAVQDPDDQYCFNVTAKALKNNRKTKGKIIIKCNENGKKAVFTATAVNGVQGITLDSVTGMTDNTVSGAAVSELRIVKSDTDKKTGGFSISTTKSDNNFETTDTAKIYIMGNENGFDKAQMEKGKVKITAKPDSNQKKLIAKLNKDKKTVTVTAAKKVPAGTITYYLIMYNNKENTGYKIIKIVSVE